MEIIVKVLWALAAYVASWIGAWGYYPLIPAIFAVYCTKKEKSALIYAGLIAGIGMNISLITSVKYFCLLPVIYVGTKFYGRIGRTLQGTATGAIAGAAVAVINLAGSLVGKVEIEQVIAGISEGLLTAGATILIHYLLEISLNISWERSNKIIVPAGYVPDGRVTALMSAFEGLSQTFGGMYGWKQNNEQDDINLIQQELVDSVCVSCPKWDQCWQGSATGRAEAVKKMLKAVMDSVDISKILGRKYIKQCDKYEQMVKAAREAFGRLELNYSWHRRLQENRAVIARQFDAMESLLKDWQKKERSLDARSRIKKAKIIYEAMENGVEIKDIHLSQMENQVLKIRLLVCSDSGTSSRKLLKAVEKAVCTRLRLKQDTPSIIPREAIEIVMYEDTEFYILPGAASRKKNGSIVSGDTYSFFMLEDGNYNLCLSDGMGSGVEAGKESETVIELFQNFLEAGFGTASAVKMMNAAMVLRGEDGMFSTLDNASVNLYTGRVTMVKIGASSTFIKRGGQVECIRSESLPTGVDLEQSPEQINCLLSHGDFLVMVSDGVIEYLQVDKPEEVLTAIIGETTTDNSGAMAREILDKVLSYTGGYAMDDMTVLVAGIWEK